MSDSASQVVVESASKGQMATMLQELMAKNAEMKKALAAVKPGPAAPAATKARADPEVKETREELETQVQEEEEDDGDEEDAEGGDDEGEEQAEEEEDTAEKASAITPAPKAAKPPPAITPPPTAPAEDLGEFANAKSSTHRKEWMAFSRRMESDDAPRKFPQVLAIWDSSKEDPVEFCVCVQCIVYSTYDSISRFISGEAAGFPQMARQRERFCKDGEHHGD